jgi:hypothetical protein
MSAKFWNDEDSIPICIVPASAGYEDEDDDTDGWFSVVQGVIVEYWGEAWPEASDGNLAVEKDWPVHSVQLS